jgi:hypothetical protein
VTCAPAEPVGLFVAARRLLPVDATDIMSLSVIDLANSENLVVPLADGTDDLPALLVEVGNEIPDMFCDGYLKYSCNTLASV